MERLRLSPMQRGINKLYKLCGEVSSVSIPPQGQLLFQITADMAEHMLPFYRRLVKINWTNTNISRENPRGKHEMLSWGLLAEIFVNFFFVTCIGILSLFLLFPGRWTCHSSLDALETYSTLRSPLVSSLPLVACFPAPGRLFLLMSLRASFGLKSLRLLFPLLWTPWSIPCHRLHLVFQTSVLMSPVGACVFHTA